MTKASVGQGQQPQITVGHDNYKANFVGKGQ